MSNCYHLQLIHPTAAEREEAAGALPQVVSTEAAERIMGERESLLEFAARMRHHGSETLSLHLDCATLAEAVMDAADGSLPDEITVAAEQLLLIHLACIGMIRCATQSP